MKKRINMSLLVMTLIIGNLLFNYSYVFASTNVLSIESNIVYELDEKGQKLNNETNFQKNMVNFTQIDTITDNKIKLLGNVKSGEEVLDFEIMGDLKKSNNSENKVVGENLTDKLGNFIVVHLAIDLEPANSSFYFNKDAKRFNKAIKLYLFNKNSKDFTIVETQNKQLIERLELDTDIKELDTVEEIEELWYGKIMKPIDRKEETPIMVNAQGATNYRYYYDFYNVGGEDVTERIQVAHYLGGPSKLTDQGYANAKLSIASEKTTSEYGYFNSNESHFRIGKFGTNKIQLVTDPGVGIDLVQWTSYGVSPGSLGFKISWNTYSKSYGPLGFTATYNHSSITQPKIWRNFANSSSSYTRQAQVDYGSNKIILTEPNHAYDIQFNIGNYNASGRKSIGAQFIYNVSNTQGDTYIQSGSGSRYLYFDTK